MVESNSDTISGEDNPACTRLSLSQMEDKLVILVTEDGEAVATGVVHACEPTDCVDNTQLDADDVGVFNLQSNGHAALPDDWRFFVQRWLLSRVQYKGISLLRILQRHEQENLNSSSTCMSLRQYNSTRRRRVMSTTRLERKLCENSICFVASENCCPMSCTQYFPRKVVKVVKLKCGPVITPLGLETL
jgi:hypothetical protein